MSIDVETDFIERVLRFADNEGIEVDHTEESLKYLEYFLSMHFPAGEPLSTLETGCDVSTILFSQYSTTHNILDFNERASYWMAKLELELFTKNANISVLKDLLPLSSIEIKDESLDIILLGAAKPYPLPDLDLFYLAPKLRQGGILVINNIDIPSVANLYNYLLEDDAFFICNKAKNTVFFYRTGQPLPNLASIPWYGQKYGAQKYASELTQSYHIDLPIPTSIRFRGHQKSLDPWFKRGFFLWDGRPATNGVTSYILLPFQKPICGPVVITLDIEVIGANERESAGVTIKINSQENREISFANTQKHQIEIKTEISECSEIRIDFVHCNVRSDLEFSPLNNLTMPGFVQPNFVIHGLSVSTAGDEKQEDIQQTWRMDGSIVTFSHQGQVIRFFVENVNDSIQAHHNVGEFYETEELELISPDIPQGSRILDVGANIGNHTVWFEKVLKASLIVPVEPQAKMITLFNANCQLNGMDRIDRRCLGIALGDVNQSGKVQIDDDFNPAGARIEPSEDGQIEIRIGDEVLADDIFDFIKIDVEGAELNVLKGLKKLISRCKPLLFVEVWEENRTEFDQLMTDYNYEVIKEFRRYPIATNLLMRYKGSTSLFISVKDLLRSFFRILRFNGKMK